MAVPSDWRRARSERRAAERRLPESLQQEVRVIRRADLGQDAVEAVFEDVRTIALRQGDLRRVHSAKEPSWSYVPPAVERDLLQELARNRTYHRQVRADVRSTLRVAHLIKIDPGAARITVPEALPPVATVKDGALLVKSSIGLGTATALEAEPEGWDHWTASTITNRSVQEQELDVDLGFEPGRRVLVLGALAGGFARTVTAMGLSRMAVAEIDWVLPDATNLPCVERRGLADPMGTFDAAVAVFPSPATSGAANQRGIYNRSLTEDLAQLGARRWARLVVGYLGLLNVALEAGAIAYVLLPLGVRDERKYIAAPDLLDRILSRLDVVGFEVVANTPTVEVEPVAQPFVGTTRPQKTTLVLKKTHSIEGV
jgi:hypothetical protein